MKSIFFVAFVALFVLSAPSQAQPTGERLVQLLDQVPMTLDAFYKPAELQTENFCFGIGVTHTDDVRLFGAFLPIVNPTTGVPVGLSPVIVEEIPFPWRGVARVQDATGNAFFVSEDGVLVLTSFHSTQAQSGRIIGFLDIADNIAVHGLAIDQDDPDFFYGLVEDTDSSTELLAKFELTEGVEEPSLGYSIGRFTIVYSDSHVIAGPSGSRGIGHDLDGNLWIVTLQGDAFIVDRNSGFISDIVNVGVGLEAISFLPNGQALAGGPTGLFYLDLVNGGHEQIPNNKNIQDVSGLEVYCYTNPEDRETPSDDSNHYYCGEAGRCSYAHASSDENTVTLSFGSDGADCPAP